MDAGHLQIASTPVNLSKLIDEWLDDLGSLPDSPDVKIEKEFPVGLFVAGERQYTSLIVQNLLENARKYNRPGGCIRVSALANGKDVVLAVGNTGRTIPPGEDIFERFHHSSTPSAVSGHGIGLNLARELARLHGGDLRLVRSENDWTEFEVRFSAVDGGNGVALSCTLSALVYSPGQRARSMLVIFLTAWSRPFRINTLRFHRWSSSTVLTTTGSTRLIR